MAHRTILTERQCNALFDLPTDDPSLLKHYTLVDDDLEFISERRPPENKLVFALQLRVLRYLGRLLLSGEDISEPVGRYLAIPLSFGTTSLADYIIQKEICNAHLANLKEVYKYSYFSSLITTKLKM